MKLIRFLFIIFYYINAFASCKDTPIQEYAYMTEEQLKKNYVFNKNSSDSSLNFAKKYMELNAFREAEKLMNDSGCYNENKNKIKNVLGKDFKYTKEMLDNL